MINSQPHLPELQFLFSRRSIRLFEPRPVSAEQIQTLLEAAMAAPSAAAKDPWRFLVVQSQPRREEIAKVLPAGKMIAQSPLGIVVCGDLEAAHDRQLSYLLQDCAAAIENLLLAAHLMGLGGCWLGVHPREERVQALREMFRLPPSVIPVSCLAIGHPAEVKPARTRFNPLFVRHENW